MCGAINPRKLIPPTIEIDDPANITDKINSIILIRFIRVPNAIAIESPRFKISS